MNKNLKVSIILGLMCFFLTAGIVIQINTVSKSTTTVGKTLVENELRDSVLRWKQKYENAYEKLEEKQETLDALREQVSSTDETHSGMSFKLAKYNALLGNTELIGKGIIITVKDGDGTGVNGAWASDYIVHDGDLYEIVNALKNAGAEAISINGQRIVSKSSITCAGNVVLINGEKVGVPYEIKAIGLPSMLYGSVTMPNGYLDWMINDGVSVDVDPVEKETIVIPKYNGIYKYEYATIFE
ncbi:MAG: DUF881 domain-containing protein [Clostridia bacterium]|nr:DUF881 domain-containing protein [Clostridia bacterium]